MVSEWIKLVKQIQGQQGISYKEALVEASKKYQSGGSSKSNYIKHIMYKDKFDVSKMKEKSDYFKKKEPVKKVEELTPKQKYIQAMEKGYNDNMTALKKEAEEFSKMNENDKSNFLVSKFGLYEYSTVKAKGHSSDKMFNDIYYKLREQTIKQTLQKLKRKISQLRG